MRVRRGMRIHVGDRLGSINNQAHVHLAVGTGGFETNAVALGFQGYADHFAPRITDVPCWTTTTSRWPPAAMAW